MDRPTVWASCCYVDRNAIGLATAVPCPSPHFSLASRSDRRPRRANTSPSASSSCCSACCICPATRRGRRSISPGGAGTSGQPPGFHGGHRAAGRSGRDSSGDLRRHHGSRGPAVRGRGAARVHDVAARHNRAPATAIRRLSPRDARDQCGRTAATSCALAVVGVSKFTTGAWISAFVIVGFVVLFRTDEGVQRSYGRDAPRRGSNPGAAGTSSATVFSSNASMHGSYSRRGWNSYACAAAVPCSRGRESGRGEPRRWNR